MGEDEKCAVCDQGLMFRWTDVHGVAACVRCGTPYRILHYDESGKRVAKPPELLTKPAWTPIMRRYWAETKRHCDPASAYNFIGSRSAFDRPEDLEAFNTWMETHKDELPKEEEVGRDG